MSVFCHVARQNFFVFSSEIVWKGISQGVVQKSSGKGVKELGHMEETRKQTEEGWVRACIADLQDGQIPLERGPTVHLPCECVRSMLKTGGEELHGDRRPVND